MGIIDTLLGRNEPQAAPAPPPVVLPTTNAANTRGTTNAPDADAQAVARYRYMLQTAPPETVEQAHTEAFARLTPEQRRLALQQLANVVTEDERASLQDDPQSMARAATRAEVRQPGVLERTFGGGGMGMGSMGMGGRMGMMGGGGGIGMGGLLAGGLLTSIAGSFIGSSIAHSFFDQPDVTNNFYDTNPDMAAGNSGDNASSYAENSGADAGYTDGDSPYADTGADAGQGYDTADLGGGEDFGGGDFGGDV